jgi:hypothetical protein
MYKNERGEELTTWIPKFLRLIPSGTLGGMNSGSPSVLYRIRSFERKVDVKSGGLRGVLGRVGGGGGGGVAALGSALGVDAGADIVGPFASPGM